MFADADADGARAQVIDPACPHRLNTATGGCLYCGLPYIPASARS